MRISILLIIITYIIGLNSVVNAQIRILPLGNSLTYDNNISDSRDVSEKVAYRKELYDLLITAGYNFDFVGSEVSGEPTVLDGDNAGFPGINTAQLFNLLSTGVIDQSPSAPLNYNNGDNVTAGAYLDTYNPDAILLHIGTNDVNSASVGDIPDIVSDLGLILDEIDIFESNSMKEVPVFLALIIGEVPDNLLTDTFNSQVTAMVSTRILAGDNIVLVDMENDAGLDYTLDPTGDFIDQYHPNTTGYDKMGQLWFSELQSYYSLPEFTSSPVLQASVSQLYQYQVTVNAFPAVTFSLEEGPSGMSIDNNTGLIEWTPDIGQIGDFDIEIGIQSLIGEETQSYTLNVSNNSICISDLINYWKLDETGGNEYQDLREQHAVCNQCPTSSTGVIDNAQLFDANSQLNVVSNGNWNWTNDAGFSIEFWFNTSNSTAGNRVIVGRDRNINFPNLHFWLGLDDVGTARFVLIDNDNVVGDIGSGVGEVINDGNWHHVVGLRDESDNSIKLYVDGLLVDQDMVNYTADFTSDVDLNIGHLSNDYHYEGLVDEILIYGRAIDESEIVSHYDNGLLGNNYCNIAPGFESSPVEEITIGQQYAYDANAIGIPFPTYSLLSAPSGMTINSQTGLINWLPGLGQGGMHSISIMALNVNGESVQNYELIVNELPDCFTGLDHYWKMEDYTEQSLFDSNGQTNGNCTDCPSVVEGIIDNARLFNTSTSVNIPDNGTFDWEAEDSFSLELWFKTSDAVNSNQVLFGRDDDSSDLHFWVGLEAGGRALFSLFNNNNQGVIIGAGLGDPLNDDNWHHLVAVRDNQLDKNLLFVDGALVEETNINYVGNFSSDVDLNIGWLNLNGGFHFQGTLDEVSMFNRALTSLDIESHFNSGIAGNDYCAFVPQILTSTLPPASVDTEYSYFLDVSGIPFPDFDLIDGPAGLTLNSTTGEITFLPTSGQVGDWSVEVSVDNGEGTDSKMFMINVGNFNNAPSFTKGPDQSVNEDIGSVVVNNWATDLDDGDSDETQNLTFNITGNTNPGIFSVLPEINSNGDLSFTTANNANGNAQITITLTDDGPGDDPNSNTSDEISFNILINALNDSPSFDINGNQLTLEDAGVQTISNFATNMNDGDPELDQTVTFQVSNSNPAIFSTQPTINSEGTLNYQPKLNAFGTANVTVTLVDNGPSGGSNINSSDPQVFSIQVTEVNDAPTLNDIADLPAVAIASGVQEVTLTGITTGANEIQKLFVSAVSSDNSLIQNIEIEYTSPNNTAVLSFTPSTSLTGSTNIEVTVSDDGLNIAPHVNLIMKSFSVTIIEDSNSPTFLVGEDIIVNEDAGEVIISNWAKNIDDGDPGLDENLVFNIVSNSNPTLFEGAPVIDPLTGNLSFNTMLNMNGQGIIGVRLVDESGLESNLQHFNITIDPINDAPKFLVGSNINIDPGEGTQLIQGWATSISDGDPELAQSISFLITSNSNPSIFIDEPSINVLGDLIFTPSNQNTGTADIFVTLTDDGESNGDNVNQSEPQRFSITVNGPTGIPEAHNDFHLEAFPNPTNGNGYIIVALSERIYGKFSLQLMDLMGKKYYENSLMNSDSNVKLNWDMATLPNGLYVIKLVHKEMVIEQKIIKN